MSEKINQYELLAPFQNKNAGFSKWTYAVKNDKVFFIKEFLDPIYPTDESISLELLKKRIKGCKEYEEKKKKLYTAIKKSADGNLVYIREFFRHKNHYYICTERIIGENIPMNEMVLVPYEDRLLLCKTIAHAIMKLHQAQVVHADIKASNVIIKKSQGGKLVGKIIDFDAGFFENDPPKYAEELNGDQIYLAPESCMFICGEDVELSNKIDVFALGILFHQYLTGEVPQFDKSEYDYVFEAVLDGQQLGINTELHPELQKMLSGMLEFSPDKRIGMKEVYACFEQLIPNPYKEKEKEKPKSPEDWFYMPGDL